MAISSGDLTGRQKAAILLISLGPDVSAQVYKHLSEEEIEKLTLEISSVKKVENNQKENVLEQFHQIALAQDYISQGGIGYAKTVLEKALGESEASNIINRLTASLQVRPFDFARKADPGQILNFIQNEHPQTIALVLSYLAPEQAGQILSELPQEVQADVAKRIAIMDSTSPEIINEVEQVLERKLSATVTQDYTQTGGIEAVVEVLNGVDRSTERTILDALEIQDPELAEEIKKRMFVFEDIVTLDNRAIQRIIRDCENEDLKLALKVSSEEVKDIIFKNMSKRMADTFKDEMEFMGPVRLRDVEEAQTRIVATIRRLEEAGEIVVARGGGDDIIVLGLLSHIIQAMRKQVRK
ncbi:flagellar motor switch protein FliG [Bacillus tianshenii]|nr:flagellar motor switch protein FliG [Bacillus tianshenii]